MLATRGAVVYLRMSLDGFQHRVVLIRGRLYYAGGTLVRDEDVPPIPETRVDAPDGSSLQLIFVPGISKLTAVRKMFIRLELLDSYARSIVAVVDTPLLLRGKPPRAFARVGGA
jgi:hypothetical protein